MYFSAYLLVLVLSFEHLGLSGRPTKLFAKESSDFAKPFSSDAFHHFNAASLLIRSLASRSGNEYVGGNTLELTLQGLSAFRVAIMAKMCFAKYSQYRYVQLSTFVVLEYHWVDAGPQPRLSTLPILYGDASCSDVIPKLNGVVFSNAFSELN